MMTYFGLSSFFSLKDKKRLLLLLLAFSCGRHSPIAEKIIPPEELHAKILAFMSDRDVEIVPKSFTEYCSNFFEFNDLSEQKDALAWFYVAISTAESRRNLFDSMYESTMGTYSVGLFSFSYGDRKSYGCKFDKTRDQFLRKHDQSLVNFDNQVDCLLRIHRKFYSDAKNVRALRDLARENGIEVSRLNFRQRLSVYWSVVRVGTDGNTRLKKALKEYMPRACSI